MVFFLKYFFPSLTWRIDSKEKNIYLTFDDGPHPEITPWVLDSLKKFNAHATFFCVGQNVKKYPEIFQRIIESNHSVGNHTMNHLNGWKTTDEIYQADILECKKLITSNLFRPPYGKIRTSQIKKLRNEFKIFMWDVLSKDYDTTLNGEECYKRVASRTENGSIIVFHDSVKAESRLRIALPMVLEYFSKNGFKFCSLNEGAR
jgi:peptidoglycan/xylan/chitin deacetylase (PgdA/CDA1 family)